MAKWQNLINVVRYIIAMFWIYCTYNYDIHLGLPSLFKNILTALFYSLQNTGRFHIFFGRLGDFVSNWRPRLEPRSTHFLNEQRLKSFVGYFWGVQLYTSFDQGTTSISAHWLVYLITKICGVGWCHPKIDNG